MNAVEFLTRVLPDTPGVFYNAHHIDHSSKKAMPGAAFHSVQEVANYAKWASGKQWSAYFACASMATAQLKEVTNGRSKPQYRATRNVINASGMKSLWMDFDVKDGKSESLTQIILDMKDFVEATHIPKPTVLVGTGNGIHFYWVTDRVMHPTEWRQLAECLKQAALAHGLLFDAGITTDAARVMRVPDTMNWKDPTNPKPVRVLGAMPEDIPYDTLSDALMPFYKQIGEPPAPQLPEGFGDMSGGLNLQAKPVDFAAVLPECKVIRDQVIEGGANADEPFWYRLIMASTYAENGKVWAHAMSSKHADYDPASTDAKFEQAMTARAQNDMGWPRCAQFHTHRPDTCKACPHFVEGKSPLNFRKAPVLNLTGAAPTSSDPAQSEVIENDIPPNYVRHPQTQIIYVQKLEKGEDGEADTQVAVPVLDYPMNHAELLQIEDRPHLRFTCVVPRAKYQASIIVTLPLSKLADKRSCCGALSEQGVMVNSVYTDRIREFLVSWTKKLQSGTEQTTRDAFGWVRSEAGIEGFAYNGVCYTAADPLPVTQAPAGLKLGYTPRGSLDVWKAGATAITNQKRPQADAVLAVGFAAPLVEFAPNCPGLIMSIVSAGSGTGKTSAMKVGQSVWGNPSSEMNMLTDTSASIANKMGSLRSLPLFWDELRGEEQTLQFVQLVFQATGGKEKARMTANLERRASGTWRTMLVAASNTSVMERVADGAPEGPAGMYRVLEIDMPKVDKIGASNFVAFSEVIDRVADNYGHAGDIYARYLGANHAEVRAMVLSTAEKLSITLDASQEERFWVFTIATLLVGAHLANKLELTTIDIGALAKHLVEDVFPRQRRSLVEEGHVEASGASKAEKLVEVLARFLAHCHEHQTYVSTDKSPKPGPQTPGDLPQVLHPQMGSGIRVTHVDAHYIQSTRLLRVSSKALHNFLVERKIFRRGYIGDIERELPVTRTVVRMGAGTPFVSPTTEKAFTFDMADPRMQEILP